VQSHQTSDALDTRHPDAADPSHSYGRLSQSPQRRPDTAAGGWTTPPGASGEIAPLIHCTGQAIRNKVSVQLRAAGGSASVGVSAPAALSDRDRAGVPKTCSWAKREARDDAWAGTRFRFGTDTTSVVPWHVPSPGGWPSTLLGLPQRGSGHRSLESIAYSAHTQPTPQSRFTSPRTRDRSASGRF
jgi:hypothetical protein